MITRRLLLAMAAVATLSACAAPLVDKGDAAEFRVAAVTVDASAVDGVIGRQFDVGSAQIASDVKKAVEQELASTSTGTRPVNVSIAVQEVFLANVATIAVGAQSKIKSVVSVTDATTGAVIIKPIEVEGVSLETLQLGGLVGAAIKAGTTAEEDYRATVSRYAVTLRTRLLGDET